MRRLGIVVIYDEKGIIDEYVEVLLSSLCEVLQELFLVINGCIEYTSILKLKKYTDKIVLRSNIGFDGGAYKDIFLCLLSQDYLKRFDEVILMNDTFYGPVQPISQLLQKFEREDLGFWGITRHPRGRWPNRGIIESHVQTYFIGMRSCLIQSQDFIDFWKNIPDLLERQEVINNFEIGFTSYFEARGFCGKTLMDLEEKYSFCDSMGNPYFLHSFELIRELKAPFLKRKVLLFESPGYLNALDAIEYIENNLDYDTNLIWSNINRLIEQGAFSGMLDYQKLNEFYINHAKIYIFGAGKYGKKMEKYFQYRNWKFEKFLVSQKIGNLDDCMSYDEVKFNKDDGVILALGKISFGQVYPIISNIVNKEQLFLLNYAV